MRRKFLQLYLGLAASLASVVSCSAPELDARGTVTVNGRPLETGSIHFTSAGAASTTKSAGATVTNGDFRFPKSAGLQRGKFMVTVEGFKKTGRMVADPQRGQISENVQLHFRNTPLEVDVTDENSTNLQIALETGS